MKLYLSPQSSEPLLLRMGIYVGADYEGYDVEERYPCVLRQEFLRKSQA